MARDLRRYARDTNFRLFIGFFLVLLIVGEGLIYIFYGKGAALMGLACLVVGVAPLALIGLVFLGLDWVVRRSGRGER